MHGHQMTVDINFKVNQAFTFFGITKAISIPTWFKKQVVTKEKSKIEAM